MVVFSLEPDRQHDLLSFFLKYNASVEA